MQTNHIRTFVEVSKLRNLTKAARELNLTQPAVTQHIRALEDELHVRLIDRSTKPISLTEAGTLLAPRAKAILQMIDSTTAAIADLRQGIAGTVRIGAGSTTCIHTLPEIIDGFKRESPNVDIMVTSGTTMDILEKLRDGHLDLGIVTSPVRESWTTVIPLFEDEIVIISEAKTCKSRPIEETEVPVSFLADNPWIAFKRGHGFRAFTDAFLQSLGISPDIRVELDDIEAMKELVRVGLGIALVPRSALTPRHRSGGDQLRVVRVQGAQRVSRTTSILVAKERYLSAACSRFVTFTAEWFGKRVPEPFRQADQDMLARRTLRQRGAGQQQPSYVE